VSLTADGKTIVSVQSARTSNLWVAPGGNADEGSKITFDSGRDEGLSGIAWTTDGRILHSERISGETDIWSINSDGSGLTQITKNSGRNFYPVVSHDGRYIIFISDRNGSNDIWRVDIDGRNPKQITNIGPVTASPSISADSKWVFYGVTVDKIRTIFKSSIEGGQPIRLTNTNSLRPIASPAGETFVCHYGDDNNLKVAEFTFEGGEPKRTFDLPNVIKSVLVQWNTTGDGLIYRDSKNRIDNLWLQPLNGSPAKQLTDFRSDQIFAFEWTRDGQNLVLSRGRTGSDVVLITQFK
jgi:Tol biopolymer transport system component